MKLRLKRTVRVHPAVILPALIFWSSCNAPGSGTPVRKDTPVVAQPNKEVPPPRDGSRLFLAQAQFIYEKGEDGEEHPIPGPACLSIHSYIDGEWKNELIEDPDSNVFHKAIWWKSASGESGILTIGATKAFLKFWQKIDGKWTAQTLWNPTFGGKFDRLRDFEIADVTGDGTPDIVIATHDQGVVGVVEWKDGAVKTHEISRKANTFVHEIETGDVDQDGVTEIFTTPSLPNKLDGTPQPGEIDIFEFSNGEWHAGKVDSLEKRHAKEILCVKLDQENAPVLFASLEGENLGGQTDEGDSTRIRMYRFSQGRIDSLDIASLPGRLCRFLNYGDTDGDGRKEIVASTKNSGIWKLQPQQDKPDWKKDLIATGTSGFEHATILSDLNGDGKDEVYVASDDQGELRVYEETNGSYQYSVIGKLRPHVITFNVTTAVPE